MADWRVPKRRPGHGHREWQTLSRDERGWGPWLDQQVRHDGLGLSRRDRQASRDMPLGEGWSVASCHRLVASGGQRAEAFTRQPLAAPPPRLLVEGMWSTIADPSGQRTVDSQGRRRAVQRQPKRVRLSALGVWPDGHWAIVHGQMAAGEQATTWQTFCGPLAAQGMPEEPTQLVVSEGAPGRERALDAQCSGVPHQRGIFHTIKPMADHLLYGELEVEGETREDQAKRKAQTARKQAM